MGVVVKKNKKSNKIPLENCMIDPGLYYCHICQQIQCATCKKMVHTWTLRKSHLKEISERRQKMFDDIVNLRLSKSWEEVIELCDQVIKINKKDYFVMGYKGEAQIKVGKEEEGKKTLMKVISENNSNQPDDIFAKARAHHILDGKLKKKKNE